MIGSWAVHVLLVSALVSVAAWLAERGARAQRWATRWVWAAALTASVLVPLAAWLLPSRVDPAPIAAVPGSYVMNTLPPLTLVPAEPAAISPGTLLLAAWAVATAVPALGLLVMAVRLERHRRRWSARTVAGVEVLVSRRTGPAALGILRGRVVLPEWALSMPEPRRRLLVLHEAEHVRAGDPRLALLGLAVCALVPWNLPLWWQLRRLRLAIEVDCDARVLRRTGDPRGYGSLLLEVGQRRTRLALALAEPRPMLERRIRMITTTTRRATLRAAGLAVGAGLLLAVACETPGPTELSAPEQAATDLETTLARMSERGCAPIVYVGPERSSAAAARALDASEVAEFRVFRTADADAAAPGCGVMVVVLQDASPDARERTLRLIEGLAPRQGGEQASVATLAEVEAAPTFTPMTVRPALNNPDAVRTALEELYPPLLKEAGIGGTANVWLLIDTEGSVHRVRINRPSGHDALDQAALRVAQGMEFSPAYNRDQRVPVWVALDVTFEAEAAARQSLEESAAFEERLRARDAEARARGATPAPTRSAAELRREPTFTPMTERPRLRNDAEVSDLLMAHYPSDLRDAGIGGTVNVWFFVDQAGTVQEVGVNRGSGYPALDDAALEVARLMEFTPALNRDQPVPVWVALDIGFEVQ